MRFIPAVSGVQIPLSLLTRDHSSAGRAPALQAGGHRFEPCWSHYCESSSIKYGEIAQLARACGSYPQCRGFKSLSRYLKKNPFWILFLLCDKRRNVTSEYPFLRGYFTCKIQLQIKFPKKERVQL